MSKKKAVSLVTNNVIRLEPTATPKPRVTWDEGEVAKRALEWFELERKASTAYSAALRRADEFKEENAIVRVDLNDPEFQDFTRDTWFAYLDAKAEVKKAKARLDTACRRVLNPPAPPLTKGQKEELKRWAALVGLIERGEITMKDALAVRKADGAPMVRDRAHFIELATVSEEDLIPF
ncbi:hypothetical protein ACFPTO_02110 [Paraburkholderia denitrificans]|uniref:Uncharacterized protein n=1 Tax=Paraburkholderia denitrificans TaxID=694025 RepID=A0ABW0J3K7_9BURK